jgi:hypothetical protein
MPGPRQIRLALHDRLEWPAEPPGVVAQGGGDADATGEPQDGDNQVAQAGHDAGAAGGADLGPVLIEIHVPDPVQTVFDAPVAADDARELG